MNNEISKESISLMECELKNLLEKGAQDLKVLYFNFALKLETNNIGINHVYISTYRLDDPDHHITINRDFIYNYNRIKKEELASLFPKVNSDKLLEIIKECSFILKSMFFDKLQSNYSYSSIGLVFMDNKLKFDNDDMEQEFKLYKANIQKEKLENELANKQLEQPKKHKI